MHACIHACMHVCECACLYACMCASVCGHACMPACVNVCVCMCAYVHAFVCVCVALGLVLLALLQQLLQQLPLGRRCWHCSCRCLQREMPCTHPSSHAHTHLAKVKALYWATGMCHTMKQVNQVAECRCRVASMICPTCGFMSRSQ